MNADTKLTVVVGIRRGWENHSATVVRAGSMNHSATVVRGALTSNHSATVLIGR